MPPGTGGKLGHRKSSLSLLLRPESELPALVRRTPPQRPKRVNERLPTATTSPDIGVSISRRSARRSALGDVDPFLLPTLQAFPACRRGRQVVVRSGAPLIQRPDEHLRILRVPTPFVLPAPEVVDVGALPCADAPMRRPSPVTDIGVRAKDAVLVLRVVAGVEPPAASLVSQPRESRAAIPALRFGVADHSPLGVHLSTARAARRRQSWLPLSLLPTAKRDRGRSKAEAQDRGDIAAC